MHHLGLVFAIATRYLYWMTVALIAIATGTGTWLLVLGFASQRLLLSH